MQVCVRPIVLVGLMGAGKSSVGRKLAEHMGYDFIDMDQYLCVQTGLSVSELFSRYGEVAFRDREEVALSVLLNNSPFSILSTGGGAVLRAANRFCMREKGRVLYLHASAHVLIDRLQRTDLRQRPVLGSKEGLSEKLKSLYTLRDPLYREVAHTVVETEKFTPRQLAYRLSRSILMDNDR